MSWRVKGSEYFSTKGKFNFKIRTTMHGRLYIATRVCIENGFNSTSYRFLDSPRFRSLNEAKHWCDEQCYTRKWV